ncbi:NACHT domain-containing protein [Actinacidiphila glaucinigra]|uniref:NACHT domain-containing protein n=1 Tax=Actinacidiphila glaucinigra TaxID=235986 RepID=UPI003723E4D1
MTGGGNVDPSAVGVRLASSVAGPLVKRLFVAEGPGAGLVDRPVRISSRVSFRGEKRTLTDADLRALAAGLVRRALRAGERPVGADEETAVADALAASLRALGDLDLTDVQAVDLGHTAFARALRRAAHSPERELSADGAHFHERLLDTACLHILHFFTQRSTFVAATQVEQSRALGDLTARVDALISRTPLPGGEDAAFERRYLDYVAKKYGRLTIHGLDLADAPDRWPLDTAYLSLEAVPSSGPAEGGTEESAGPRAADRALAAHERVLLRGEAGSGKTTLVQWLATACARQDPDEGMAHLEDRIPFVLPLRTLTRHGERLPAPRGFLAAAGCPLAGTQPAGWEARVLAEGRGLLLVDGIDEIPDAERRRTRAWLGDLLDAHPGNRWLVTSRPSAVREDWLAAEGFTELALTPMGPADVAAFVGRWHAAAGPEAAGYAEGLLAALRAEPDLGRLATNPLMCGLICALHHDRRGYLPRARKDLYAAALSMLLVRRDREREAAVVPLREEAQTELLQRLAYWLVRNGRTEMDLGRAEAVVARALPAVPEAAALGDAGAVLAHLLDRGGVLRRAAPGSVDFVHRTFQDHLGARAAVDEGDFGLLAAHAADDRWEDVLRMAVALAGPRERAAILRELLDRGDLAADRRTRARLHLLAAASLEDSAALDPEVREAVERRAAALVPPADAGEARALAEAGPLVLDLLPGPGGLSDTEALHVVVTACHLPSDRAVRYLAGFAAHRSLRVRAQLMWSWHRFDCALYAREVVARLDPDGLDFTVRSAEQLRELRGLGLRPTRLDLRGDLPADELAEYVAGLALTEVRVKDCALNDLRFLAGQRELRRLVLVGPGAPADWTSIGGLPALRELELAAPAGGRLDLSPLAAHPGPLTVRVPLPADRVTGTDRLPAGVTVVPGPRQGG